MSIGGFAQPDVSPCTVVLMSYEPLIYLPALIPKDQRRDARLATLGPANAHVLERKEWPTLTPGIEVAQKFSISNGAKAEWFDYPIWIWELNNQIILPLLHDWRNIFAQPLSLASMYLIRTSWVSAALNNFLSGIIRRWGIGCVSSRPAVKGSQEAGFTQPRARQIAHFLCLCWFESDSQELWIDSVWLS